MKMKSLMALALTLSTISVFASEVEISKIPADILARHKAACPEFATEDGKYLQRERYKLPGSEYSPEPRTLYVLGCEMYAYNSSERAYIETPYEAIDVSIAEVLGDGSIVATNNLMGAGFDEATQTLGTFQKGRGIGDCGSAASYKYSPENEKFVLVEARVKDSCDGEVESEWPIVYKK